MNRRHFLASCLFGAPLIAIPSAAYAHFTTYPGTMTPTPWPKGGSWPTGVIEMTAYNEKGWGLSTDVYLVPTWGKKDKDERR